MTLSSFLAVWLLAASWVQTAGAVLPEPERFYSDLKLCPATCHSSNDPSNWTMYHDIRRLDVCNQPVLLDFNLHTKIEDQATDVTIRSCTVGDADANVNLLLMKQPFFKSQSDQLEQNSAGSAPRLANRADANIFTADDDHHRSNSCSNATRSAAETQLLQWGMQSNTAWKDVEVASGKLQEYFARHGPCHSKVMLAKYNETLVGVYLGSSVDNRSAKDLIQTFINNVQDEGVGTRKAIQMCRSNSTANEILGVVADTKGNFSAIQAALKSWRNARCLKDAEKSRNLSLTYIWLSKQKPGIYGHNESVALGHNHTTRRHIGPHGHPNVGRGQARRHISFKNISARDGGSLSEQVLCKTIRVFTGDSCASLAGKCGVSGNDFMDYNSQKSNLCSTLAEGQEVCCSRGTLPDRRPKPGNDGICAWKRVEAGEYCQLIAASNGLELEDLSKFNQETWGWTGCNNLQAGLRICLSEGRPPMPEQVSNAVCGPTVPGTLPSVTGQKLADMNPCPLNACCNIWGQCGTTSDFCTVSKSPTGNPGTSAPGENGCISNCGTKMITGAPPEGGFKKIGYFEAWNYARSCLQMNVLRIDSSYTHVHFSFAEIDNNFNIVIPERMKDQWDAFISNKTPFKKILAFGGWAFSTEARTAHVLPQAVSDANRDLFSRRVVQFAIENKLDGLDFDWEYPGATDINNVPGSEEDGPNYLKFLANVRKRLPGDKSLSIAAPASFWYLKAFPVRNIARVVDYIVYMTYDLHGQWDVGNRWASPGCPEGNCLRSHVNMTETINALTMITKAGVPSAKIIVGVSSYGRSFRMETPDCTGPDCRYLGTRQESKAKKGRCTDTAGYIANAELREIIDENKNIKKWYDSETDTDYLVYDDVEWVAYMNEGTKMGRSLWYELSHFGGTSDWAVDLQYFLIRPTDPEPWGNFDSPIDVEQAPPSCYARFNSLEELDKAEFDKRCGPQYILATLGKMMHEAVNEYNNILKGDYDKYFDLYAKHMVGSVHDALQSFLTEKGNKYFNCKIVEEVTCCRGCEYKHGKGSSQCRYCEYEMCAQSTPWGLPSKWMNVSQPCPNDMSKRGLEPEEGYKSQTVFWDLPSDYADKFWTDVSNELGVPMEKFHITPERRIGSVWNRRCDEDGVWFKPDCHVRSYWFHAPEIRDFHKSDVYNPKTVVKSAIDALSHMGNDLEVMSLEISLARFEVRGKDLVDAVSVPVLMVQEALKAMKKVAEFGKDIEEKDKKMLALNFLMALFFVLPAIGNAVASVGLATLGRFLAAFGELGNIGQGIYEIVDDPKSAPLAIFGIILGAGALKDIAKVRKAADLQRGMSSQMIKAMGGDVEARLNIIKRRGDTGQKQPNLCLV